MTRAPRPRGGASRAGAAAACRGSAGAGAGSDSSARAGAESADCDAAESAAAGESETPELSIARSAGGGAGSGGGASDAETASTTTCVASSVAVDGAALSLFEPEGDSGSAAGAARSTAVSATAAPFGAADRSCSTTGGGTTFLAPAAASGGDSRRAVLLSTTPGGARLRRSRIDRCRARRGVSRLTGRSIARRLRVVDLTAGRCALRGADGRFGSTSQRCGSVGRDRVSRLGRRSLRPPPEAGENDRHHDGDRDPTRAAAARLLFDHRLPDRTRGLASIGGRFVVGLGYRAGLRAALMRQGTRLGQPLAQLGDRRARAVSLRQLGETLRGVVDAAAAEPLLDRGGRDQDLFLATVLGRDVQRFLDAGTQLPCALLGARLGLERGRARGSLRRDGRSAGALRSVRRRCCSTSARAVGCGPPSVGSRMASMAASRSWKSSWSARASPMRRRSSSTGASETELHRERFGGGGRLLEPLALDHLLDGRRRGRDRSPAPPPFVVVCDLPSIRLEEVTRDRVVGVDRERLLHLVGGSAVAALGRLAHGLVEERFGALEQTGVARPRCRSTARILAHRWFTS